MSSIEEDMAASWVSGLMLSACGLCEWSVCLVYVLCLCVGV